MKCGAKYLKHALLPDIKGFNALRDLRVLRQTL
ncbi:hypothetical protein RD1_0664 [Roseobacter denitrificans OCh 114]|uniref:Transposase n=1 Tax=Roseobacter denitrificans (strain ATCC 33942 / OCh 114) TaxID=375451 RepID=Q16CD1_ROSDO|nr:hypothetical protein RD1_0664 [Roseobacter denitrificans OCh 114]